MSDVTAKIICQGAEEFGDQVTFRFGADYADGANREWAAATPSLSLSMTVRRDVAEHFALGSHYTLTFTQEGTADDRTDAAAVPVAAATLGPDDTE